MSRRCRPGATYVAFRCLSEEMPAVLTEVWEVSSVRSGEELGRIKWYAPWRQYAFFPASGTVWNPDCLAAVTDKIETLMRIRRNVRRNQGKAA